MSDADLVKAHREALLKEYGEVAASFRLLTDIRFKLLALLPIAATAAVALLQAGSADDDATQIRALGLSIFGLIVTLALATYNARNDQHYDALVGRAANIERTLGLPGGAFANRPAAWFAVPSLRWNRHLRWPINHRFPVMLIYTASASLWLCSATAAGLQLIEGDDPAAWPIALAALVPFAGAWALSRLKRGREKQLRRNAVIAVREAKRKDFASVADDSEQRFIAACGRLGGVSEDDAKARVAFYSSPEIWGERLFMPADDDDLRAAHFVALVSDLPADWIDDVFRERRRKAPPTSG